MKKTEYDRLYAGLLNDFKVNAEILAEILNNKSPEESPHLLIYLRNIQYTYLRLAALKSIESYV